VESYIINYIIPASLSVILLYHQAMFNLMIQW